MANYNGFAGGFAQGFNLMEGHFARKDAKDQGLRAEKKADERYAQGIAFRDKQTSTANDRYQEGVDFRNQQVTTANERYAAGITQADEDRTYNRGRQKTADGMAQQSHQSQQAASAAALEASNMQLQQLKVDNILSNLAAGGTLDDKSAEILQKSNLPMRLLAGDGYQSTYETFRNISTGKMDYNDPKALLLANDVLGDRLNETVGQKGKNGGTIQDVKIGRLYPMEGGRIAVDLLIQTDKGSYNAPLTNGRSSDDSAEVKGMPAADLMEIMDGATMLSEYARQNQGLPKAVREYMIRTGKLKEPGMNTADKQQYDYYTSQIEGLAKMLSSDTIMPEEREKYMREIAGLRKKAEALIGVTTPKPEPTEQYIADLNAGKIAPEKFAAVFGPEALAKHQKQAAPKPAQQPPSQPAPQPAAPQPAAPVAPAGISPQPAAPIPMKASGVKGFQTIDRAAMSQRSQRNWNNKPRNEVVAMAVEELRAIKQQAKGNPNHLKAGADAVAEDLGLSTQELQQAISQL